MTPRFDPTRAIIYDLARGQLRDDEGESRLNLPVHLLLRLCEHAGKEGSLDFARSLGGEVGRRLVDRMGESAPQATVESWTEHLGGQLALLGLGDLSVEQWGRGLVLQVTGIPKGFSELLGPILESAITRALGRDVELVEFHTDGKSSYLVLSPAAAANARRKTSQGASLGQVIELLHQGDA